MEEVKHSKSIKGLFNHYFSVYFPLSIALVLIRVIEYTFFKNESFEYTNIWRSLSYSLEFDLIFVALVSLTLLPISVLLYIFSIKIFKIFHHTISTLLILLNILFLQFFISSQFLLDNAIFSFTWKEVMVILNSEEFHFFSKPTLLYLFGLFSLLLYFKLAIILSKTSTRIVGKLVFVTLIYCLLFFRGELSPHQVKNYTHYETKLHTSKVTYFLESLYKELSVDDLNKNEYLKNIIKYNHIVGETERSSNINFPFLKDRENKLSSQWNEYVEVNDSTNVVLIFMEGLSASFLGPNGQFKGGTPFLDSLTQKSLYWPNMMSITDRTHGVFAAALAGLPHGFKRGFLNLDKQNYPNFLALTDLFKEKNYDFNFFYGGWSGFDSYKKFLTRIGFKNYIDQEYIVNEFGVKLNKKDENSFTWGFHDAVVQESYFKYLNKRDKLNKAYFNIWLSLSLHSPFDIPNKDKYEELAKTQFEQLDPDVFEYNKDLFSAVSYSDDALRKFFSNYQKRSDYFNTVFLLMGDHSVFNIDHKNVLGIYNVPFIIYSPKLKKQKRFNEIISHWDVPNTLASLFKNKEVTFTNWLGDGVTFSQVTESKKPIYLGSFKGEIYGVIWGKYLLMNDILYNIKDNLVLTQKNNKVVKSELRELLEIYKYLNKYSIDQNKIYPF